jgi:hypothetical protein
MRAESKIVRQSVSLPAKVASQVRTMAKSRRLSAGSMLVELIENGIEADRRKQQEFSNWPSDSGVKPIPMQPSVDSRRLATVPRSTSNRQSILGELRLVVAGQ